MVQQRIGIFAHSTNPRGGVVHALHLAEELCASGQDATLLAPALPGATLFRTPRCRFIPIPARPVVGVAAMVALRIDEIARFLQRSDAPKFDIHHAQDPISANALADLAQQGVTSGFIRTVHHLDTYTDDRLNAWQDRAVRTATSLCCVSRLWQERLKQRYGRDAFNVSNGVDTKRFTPMPENPALRARLGVPAGRILLAIGGVEGRKNTLNILRAFQRLHTHTPNVRLLIAGGASLLDHGAAQAAFAAAFAEIPSAHAVHLAGVVADTDMPALYHMADALVFPSRDEGFGLCAVEAMASGKPVIVSNCPPFTEHFSPEDALFTNPDDPMSIEHSMMQALEPATAQRLRTRGPIVATRFGWHDVARRHVPIYNTFATQEQIDA
jgi:glycosyltransferase-like protein